MSYETLFFISKSSNDVKTMLRNFDAQIHACIYIYVQLISKCGKNTKHL